jgi:hypothetical protein
MDKVQMHLKSDRQNDPAYFDSTDPDLCLVEGLHRRDLCCVQLLVSRKYQALVQFMLAFGLRQCGAERRVQGFLRPLIDQGFDSFDAKLWLFDTWLYGQAIEALRADKSLSPEVIRPEPLALALAFRQNLNLREIALLLDTSIARVEHYLRRARRHYKPHSVRHVA